MVKYENLDSVSTWYIDSSRWDTDLILVCSLSCLVLVFDLMEGNLNDQMSMRQRLLYPIASLS